MHEARIVDVKDGRVIVSRIKNKGREPSIILEIHRQTPKIEVDFIEISLKEASDLQDAFRSLLADLPI